MRYVIVATCLAMCISADESQADRNQDIQYNASPYPVITNNNDISIPINIPINVEAIQNFTQNVTYNIRAHYDNAKEITREYVTYVAEYYEKTYNTIAEHPIYTGLACIAMWHLSLNGYAWWLSYRLEQPSSWSKWKYHLSNEELQQYPVQTIGYDLVCEIQRRYTDAQNPDQFMKPLVAFADAISTEYYMLKRYKWICRAIEWSTISRFSWYDTNLYELVDMRLQRLNFIWNTFVSWLAELKITQHQNQRAEAV